MKTIKVKGYLLNYDIEGSYQVMKVRYKKDVVTIASGISKEYGECIVERILENEEGIIDIDTNYCEIYKNGYGRKLKW